MTELTDTFDSEDLPDLARRVRGLAGSIVSDSHRAEDVAQEVVLHEMRRGGDSEPRSRGWFVRTIRNLASKDARGAERRRRREAAVAGAESSEVSAADTVQHAETLQRVVAAALSLDEPYRSTILRRYLQDESIGAVARAMGVPESTVRVRTKRALERLRESLRRSLGGAYALLLVRFAESAPRVVPAPEIPSSQPRVHTEGLEMKHWITMTAASIGALAFATANGMFSPESSGPRTLSLDGSGTSTVAMARAVDMHDGRSPADLIVATSPTAETDSSSAVQPPFTGRVVDHAGRPVSGATVRVFDRQLTGSDKMHSGARCAAPLVVTTDADGRFSTSERHPFHNWGLAIDAPGCATTVTSFRGYKASEPFVVYPATTLLGTVTDAATGAPLAGTLVRVVDASMSNGRVVRSRAARADAAGRYRLPDVAALRRLRVEFAKPGAAPWFVTLDLNAEPENTYDVALASGAELDVLALDSASLAPVAGARVYRVGFETEPLGETDSQGRFRVELPAVATASNGWGDERHAILRVEKVGYCATQSRAPKVAAGDVGELELRMIGAGSITGTVRDPSGAPVEGAVVGWQELALRFVEPSSSAIVALDSREAVTDASGRFALPHVLPTDRSVNGALRIEHGGLVARVDDPLPEASGAVRDFDVVLGADSSISGVTTAGGRAAPAWVSLESVDAPATRRSCVTTDAGAFTFFGLVDGRYRVKATSADGANMRATPVEVEVDGADVRDVAVEFATEVATITGRALYDDGDPLEGWTVLAFASGEVDTDSGDPIETPEQFEVDSAESGAALSTIVSSTAAVRADGTFVMSVKPNARMRYVLGVYRGAFGSVVRNVRQGMTDVEMRMPKLAPVRVRLTRAADGSNVTKAGIRWSHPESGREVTLAWRRSWDVSEGVLSLTLPVGNVSLTLRDAATGVVREREILIPADGIADAVGFSF